MPGRLAMSNKVWQGVLIMWDPPYLIEYLNEAHENWDVSKKKLREWGIKQKDIDSVLRAVDWAKGKRDAYRV